MRKSRPYLVPMVLSGAGAPPPATMLLYDSFTAIDGTLIQNRAPDLSPGGANWGRPVLWSPTIYDNAIRCEYQADGSQSIATQDLGVTDFFIAATYVVSNHQSNIICRWIDYDNYIRILCLNYPGYTENQPIKRITIQPRVAAAWQASIAVYDHDINHGDILRISVVSDVIRLWVNTTELTGGGVACSTHNTSTKVGLDLTGKGTTGRVDDYTAWDGTGGAVPDGWPA